MKYKKRLLESRLKALVERFPVIIVSGARQVGKSTLLGHALPSWKSVVFDPAVDIGNARADPDLFLDNHPAPMIFDEIQFAAELVPAIKRRVDADRKPGRYVLTGSQQWSVLKSASESLAGRAVFLDLDAFSLAEITETVGPAPWLARYLEHPCDFFTGESAVLEFPRTLYEQLWRGFLPEVDFLEEEWINDFHRAYLRTYIERDVRLLSDVGDWQQFGGFVRLAAALTAQEINYSKLGREIGVTPQTAQRWLAMMRATFLWADIPAYHGNAVKRVSAKPKGHVFDSGLACNLQMISSPRTLAGHPLTGALFESAMVGEIRKQSAALSTPPAFYHWRSHGGAEVDLVLERDGVFFPLEFKLTTRPGKADARGIKAFRETYPKLKIAPGLVISPCKQVQRLNEHDYSLPWNLR